MKAIGGRRRQIAAVYVKTALLLGALGTVVGVVLGIAALEPARPLPRLDLLRDRRRLRGRRDDPRASACSSACSRPRSRRCRRSGGRCACRCARRSRRPARRSGARTPATRLCGASASCRAPLQIGLRNVGRRRRRSIATAVMVALAVGNLLAILGLAAGISHTTHVEWRDHGEDVKLAGRGRRAHRAADPVDARSRRGRADVRRASQGRGRGRLHLGRPPGDACSATGSPTAGGTRRARSGRALASRSSSATSPASPGHASATASGSRPATARSTLRVIGIAAEPAGERNGALRPADDDAGRFGSLACRRRRLLDPHDLARSRVRRPHDHAARGHA